MAGYPFRMTGSSRSVPNSRPCLDFGQVCQLPSFRRALRDAKLHERHGSMLRIARNDGEIYVSTSPVLDPLAAESFRPCGSAR